MKRIFAALLLLMLTAPAWGQDSDMFMLRALEDEGIKFYEHADKLSGFSSCIRATLGAIEPFGSFIEAGEILTVRQYHEQFLRSTPPLLAYVLAGVHYDDPAHRGTARSFSKVIPRGACFKPPQALQDQMAGLAWTLRRARADYEESLETEGSLTSERARELLKRIDLIKDVLKVLGVPRGMGLTGRLPSAETEEEVRKLIKDLNLQPGDFLIYQGRRVRVTQPSKDKDAE